MICQWSGEILTEMYIKLSKLKNSCDKPWGNSKTRGLYAAYGTDSISCANVSANQSCELSDLERYRATRFIARLFINIPVFKDVCKRVSFVE